MVKVPLTTWVVCGLRMFPEGSVPVPEKSWIVKLNFIPMLVVLKGWLRLIVRDAPGDRMDTADSTLKNDLRLVELPAASNCT